MSVKRRNLPAWLLRLDDEADDCASNSIGEGGKSIDFHQSQGIVNFNGVVNYCTSVGDCGMACEDILEQVNEADDLVLGFDMEWPTSSQGGSNRTALIQICARETTCHLFQVCNMRRLPLALVHLLQHPRIKLVGINIVNDLWKLCRDFPITVKSIIDKALDLGKIANSVLDCEVTWNMEKLVSHVMKLKVDKNVKLRRSNWNQIPLSAEQRCYAATDAYVSLVLYKQLMKMKV